MIEVVSYPPDLGAWDQHEHPFYFEVYAETQPQLDMDVRRGAGTGSNGGPDRGESGDLRVLVDAPATPEAPRSTPPLAGAEANKPV